MRSSQPPLLAIWLMQGTLSGPHRDAIIGDIVENFRQGRSGAWFWRQ